MTPEWVQDDVLGQNKLLWISSKTNKINFNMYSTLLIVQFLWTRRRQYQLHNSLITSQFTSPMMQSILKFTFKFSRIPNALIWLWSIHMQSSNWMMQKKFNRLGGETLFRHFSHLTKFMSFWQQQIAIQSKWTYPTHSNSSRVVVNNCPPSIIYGNESQATL